MINTQLRSVEWFVIKWQAVKDALGEDDGRKDVEKTIAEQVDVDRPPRRFDKNECIAWHWPKNVSRAQMAFDHVFNGKPLPVYDASSKAIAEKEKIKKELEAKLVEAKLNKEIAELEEQVKVAEETGKPKAKAKAKPKTEEKKDE